MDRIAEFKAQANKMNKTLKKTYQKILSLKRLLQKRGNKPSAPEQKKLSVLTRKYLDIEAARLELQKEFHAEKCRRLSAYTAGQWKLKLLQQQASRPKRRLDGDDVGVDAQPSAPKKRKLLSC
ncbi:unnamed protein product [Rhizopus microsporus]|uniref:Uncharacterized protein n=1 Tax=Rhizopus microsporus TaxID=58291 RepID=A0A1X0SAK6_RHIZD|nr:hypothetical protein BCV71DRAFT_276942 [Rhizopus microsporus]